MFLIMLRQEHPSRIPKLPIEMRQRPPVGLRDVPIGATDLFLRNPCLAMFPLEHSRH
jgi:hypothetical protein